MTKTFIGPQDGDTIINEKVTVDGTLEHLIDESTSAIVREVVSQLEPRLRTLIQKYYYEGLSMKQIGYHLKVNESRVSQLHAKAISKMRKALHNRVPSEVLESLN